MPSIFLSHTHADRPFVEKLAVDLKRVGINVWFDKWNIGVGDSITWKVEEGIRENEFLGIVLSEKALDSQWVRAEIGAAWVKQMKERRVVILPILYRACSLPLFLADLKYADFRESYETGFQELANVLGIGNTNVLSEDNWRRFTKSRGVDWKKYRISEFERLVTVLVDRAKQYNWSSWIGSSRNPFSITLSAFINVDGLHSVSIKLDGRTYAYMAHLGSEIHTSYLRSADFNVYVGNTINECEEFVWRIMEDFRRRFGDPTEKPRHVLEKILGPTKQHDLIMRILKELSWYKGDKM